MLFFVVAAVNVDSPFLIASHLPAALLWRQRLYVPDTVRIFHDASVTREETHSRDTGDTLADPFVLVFICLVDKSLSFDVAIEIVADKVVIAVVGD